MGSCSILSCNTCPCEDQANPWIKPMCQVRWGHEALGRITSQVCCEGIGSRRPPYLLKELCRPKLGVMVLAAPIYSFTMKLYSQDIPVLPEKNKIKKALFGDIASLGSWSRLWTKKQGSRCIVLGSWRVTYTPHPTSEPSLATAQQWCKIKTVMRVSSWGQGGGLLGGLLASQESSNKHNRRRKTEEWDFFGLI